MVCPVATGWFCKSGEKLGKQLAGFKGTWTKKAVAGQAMLFVENYLCIKARMDPCMAAQKTASKGWTMDLGGGKKWDYAKGESTCNMVNGPKLW